jgi:hypothetical protein
MKRFDDALPDPDEQAPRPNGGSRVVAARYVRSRIKTPYLHAVVGTLCEVWLSGEDGPFGVNIDRVGDGIFLVQLPHDPQSALLVDEHESVAIDPGRALYDDFPGRANKSDSHRLQWYGAAEPMPEFDASRATPQSVVKAFELAPGEVRVVRV